MRQSAVSQNAPVFQYLMPKDAQIFIRKRRIPGIPSIQPEHKQNLFTSAQPGTRARPRTALLPPPRTLTRDSDDHLTTKQRTIVAAADTIGMRTFSINGIGRLLLSLYAANLQLHQQNQQLAKAGSTI